MSDENPKDEKITYDEIKDFVSSLRGSDEDDYGIGYRQARSKDINSELAYAHIQGVFDHYQLKKNLGKIDNPDNVRNDYFSIRSFGARWMGRLALSSV